MSEPVRIESPLCRCDWPAAAVHSALCPSPLRRSQRLPRKAARARKPMRTGASIGVGDLRDVCLSLVPVNRLQKEHSA